jgi:hypothetical protein
MTIRQFKKEIEKIKRYVVGQIPDENEITYRINSNLADKYPKFRNTIKELADYLATNHNLYQSIDEEGSIKLEASLKTNSPEALQYKKLYKAYIYSRKEAINTLPDENFKKTLLEYEFG